MLYILSMAMVVTLLTSTAIVLHNETEKSRIKATARKTRPFQ